MSTEKSRSLLGLPDYIEYDQALSLINVLELDWQLPLALLQETSTVIWSSAVDGSIL